MSLGKRAKTLGKGPSPSCLGLSLNDEASRRNRAIFLLSVKAGLRAQEIAFLGWDMTTEAMGAVEVGNSPSGTRLARAGPDTLSHLIPNSGRLWSRGELCNQKCQPLSCPPSGRTTCHLRRSSICSRGGMSTLASTGVRVTAVGVLASLRQRERFQKSAARCVMSNLSRVIQA